MTDVLVIDNYDSFTWNLVHYLQELGVSVRVERNDALSPDDAVAAARAILLSPGPCTPDDAGITLPVVAARSPDGAVMGLVHRDLPIHGVQFHPESIATQHGHALLANFLTLAGLVVTSR